MFVFGGFGPRLSLLLGGGAAPKTMGFGGLELHLLRRPPGMFTLGRFPPRKSNIDIAPKNRWFPIGLFLVQGVIIFRGELLVSGRVMMDKDPSFSC